jgi:catechol 2,3-dioxygenase-like lactoylglutathione lyase family enzyme
MAIAHITLATRNVVRSKEFFANTLGWKPIERPGNVGVEAAWLEITDEQQLHLVEVADFEASPFEGEFGRHIAISIPETEFDGLKSRLIAHGVQLIFPQRDTPFPRFFFKDPNGYLFEIVPTIRHQET